LELNWPMRFRIAAVAAVGIVLFGILGWRFAGQAEPYQVVSLKNISVAGVLIIAAIAVLTGFVSFFAAWPYGKEIGVQIGCNVISKDKEDKKEDKKETKQEGMYLNAALGALVCILISAVLIGILAQNVKEYDAKLGAVIAQPAKGQIVFAVIIAFLAAGFAAKKIFDLHYIYPIFAAALLTLFSFTLYAKESITAHLAKNWAAGFFANSLVSILPLQMVCLGALGSIWGYWLAVRYNYWRKHKI
jgi:hypothetical protein